MQGLLISPVASEKLILVVFDEAIYNGVDALSVLLDGFGSSLLKDDMVARAFHATKQGIVVVCSAQNSGTMDVTVGAYVPSRPSR